MFDPQRFRGRQLCSLNMEGLAEHEILAGTYEAYLLAYRIGTFFLSTMIDSRLLVSGFFSTPKGVHFLAGL